jgi:aspartate/glutamate racemase
MLWHFTVLINEKPFFAFRIVNYVGKNMHHYKHTACALHQSHSELQNVYIKCIPLCCNTAHEPKSTKMKNKRICSAYMIVSLELPNLST